MRRKRARSDEENDPRQESERQLAGQLDLGIHGQQCREIRGDRSRADQRLNCSSCQEGTGASSSSARSPFGSRYPKSATSSSQATSSSPSLTRWSSQAPRKTSFFSQ